MASTIRRLRQGPTAGKAATPVFASIGDLIAFYGRTAPNRNAILAPGRAAITYGALWQQTKSVICVLRDLGVARGDRVAVVLPGGADAAVAIMAVAAGAVCVPLYPGFTPEEWQRHFRELRVKAVVTNRDVEPASRRAARSLGIPVIDQWEQQGNGLGAFGTLGSAKRHRIPGGLAGTSEDAFILLTSGTTSRPKKVPLTHKSVCLSASNVGAVIDLTPRDRLLSVLPLFHGHGLISGVLAALAAGSSVVSTPGFDAGPFFDWLNEFQPTWYTAVPAIHRAVLSEASRHRESSRHWSLRLIRSASSSLPSDLLAGLEATFGVPVIETYGMTEAATQIAANPVGQRKLGSVGISAGAEIAIMDSGNRQLPPGKRGEVALRGPTLTRGYEDNAAANASAFQNGWFRTGDVGYLDREGYLFLIGRTKQGEVINRGGQKVSPAEIEEVLRRHPAVSEAVAFATPHKRLGEDIAAAVVPRPDAKISVDRLRRYARTHLARFKVPGQIRIVPQIPRGLDGKVERAALLALPVLPSRSPMRGNGKAIATELQSHLASIWAELLEVDEIDVEQDVFALGADSLNIAQMLSRLEARYGTRLSFDDIFDSPSVAALAARLERLEKNTTHARPRRRNKKADKHSRFRLSFQQQRIKLLSTLDPTSYNYHVVEIVRLLGPLNPDALESSVATICKRHDVLRTTFLDRLGEPMQRVGTLPPRLERVDLASRHKNRRAAAIQLIARKLLREPFDIEREPPVRFLLLCFAENDYALVIKLHHLLTDGWSQRVFWQELESIYGAEITGRPAALSGLCFQYRDFVEWQREWLKTPAAKKQLRYWRAQLEGLTEIPLRTDRPRPPMWTGRGARHHFKLSPLLSRKIRALSRAHRVTLFMTLLAAFQCLLYRYTEHSDIAVGSLIANRNQVQLEQIIGMFANTIVLRADLSGDPKFSEVLERTRQVTLDAYRNQDMPIEEILRSLQVTRSKDLNTLFRVMFIFQSASTTTPTLPDVSAQFVDIDPGTALFDLRLELIDDDDRLHGWLGYSTDLFDAATIARMAGHLRTLLAAIVANPEERISRLRLLPASELGKSLIDWNNTSVSFGQPRTFSERFARQIQRTPNAIAVSGGGVRLTYRELARRSAAVADRLRRERVGADVIVILFAERTVDFLVGLVAVQRAGGAFLALDPASPATRIAQIVQHSHTPLILAGQGSLASLQQALSTLPSQDRPQVMCLEELARCALRSPARLNAAAPSDLAYVIYTSGSTGLPKGVMVEQRGLFNHLCWQASYLELSPSDVIAQTAPQSFVISIWQFLTPLMVGARVHICADELVLDPAALAREVAREGVSVLQIVPSLLRAILEQTPAERALRALAGLRLLMCCGEPLPADLVHKWFQHFPSVSVINTYGASEVSDDVSAHRLSTAPQVLSTVPIGRPIANTRLYVLDAHLQPVPIGVPGVLYVGGLGVGRGYLNDPELTRQSFIPDPFSKDEADRLYRTGDLTRWRADGTLEFLGRVDNQVKVRGCRIELGEVEQALLAHTDVHAAAVLLRDDQGSAARLVAYIVGKACRQPRDDQLRDFLKGRLLNYMIPAGFIFLERMPLTAHGKVDRRALAAIDDGIGMAAPAFVAPRDATEAVLADIWTKLLGVDRIGIHDNFFDLGGHSLLAGQVLARAGRALGVSLPLKALFEAPTVAGLALLINPARHSTEAKLEISHVESNGPQPVTIAQENILKFERELPGLPQFNLPFAFRLKGELKIAALERALAEVVRRHDSLRARFTWLDGRPVAIIAPSATRDSLLHVEDLAASTPAGNVRVKKLLLKRAEIQAEEEAWLPFNLTSARFLRTRLLRLGANDHILLITFHHIIVDGWSIGVFIDEVSQLYSGYATGRKARLPEPALQFSDFARWQRAWCATETATQQLAYWKQQLRDVRPLFPKQGKRRGAALSSNVAYAPIHLPRDLAARLTALSRRQGVTLFMTLLTGFKTLLAARTGHNDICIVTSMANRSQLTTEGLIGLLSNPTIIRTRFDADLSFQDALSRVRTSVLDAHVCQELPFEILTTQLLDQGDENPEPLVQVYFDLQIFRRPLTLGKVSVTSFGNVSREGQPRLPIDRTWLTVTLKEGSSDITGLWTYKKNLLKAETIERWISEYQSILTRATAKLGVALTSTV